MTGKLAVVGGGASTRYPVQSIKRPNHPRHGYDGVHNEDRSV